MRKRLHGLRVRLTRKKKQLEKAIEEAESFLETIDDPVDRNILRLRCEMGLEWKEVASRTGSTEGSCKMRFQPDTKKIRAEKMKSVTHVTFFSCYYDTKPK